MNLITDLIRKEGEYKQLLAVASEQRAASSPHPLLVTGLSEGARAAFYISLASDLKKATGNAMLLIVPDEKDALRVVNVCDECGLSALTYPVRDLIFHNITASHEGEHERLAVLGAVASGCCDIVVATPDAALQYTMPPDVLARSGMSVAEGCELGEEALIAYLRSMGYVRVEMVEGTGQYAVRGGIVDFYPPRASNPVRAQFFGDEIDILEEFDIMTQRRVNRPGSIRIMPARELLVDDGVRAELCDAVRTRLSKAKDEKVAEEHRRELSELDNADDLPFIDKYISIVYPERATLLDYFTAAPLIAVQEYTAVRDRIRAFEFQMKETIKSLIEGGTISSKYTDYNKWSGDFEEIFETWPTMFCDSFVSGLTGRRLAGMFAFSTKQTVSYADNIALLRDEMAQYLSSGYMTVLLTESEAVAKNLRGLLSDGGETESLILPAVSDDASLSDVDRRVPRILYGCNIPGFELTKGKTVVLSVCENSSSYSRTLRTMYHGRRSKKSAGERIMSYADLAVGDYVVHANHGIGRYMGLETLTNDGVTRDYVKIQYDGTDVIYLPTNQLDLVSKYIGARADDDTVKLSRIGGTDWVKAKTQARGAAKEMARELIKLYAERRRKPGIKFPTDDEMQADFESAFEYDETDGQLLAVNEIKNDMEQPYPMDRLLCGDVGFGKTEVALRAAFKAVEGGYQVAILVPTTILALQHFQTLVSRMRMFPVKIEMLSRFRSEQQQQSIIRAVRRGEVDILVGTHRMVSDDVKFAKLGLLVIDEEQRFGVAQKEKIKKLATDVDVLTLTATPIPRTLNMAMSGIRDMSILEEAPGDRLPVQTYVLEDDDAILGEAVRRELRRGGQVFWLHNRVESIERTAARVAALAPDARIAVAHGKMDKEQMSDIWRAMVEGEVDILVSTTIIETGVDVPNANTLIIERADAMGLSQLHQIRGRVGRSSRRAYAYLTYPKGASLSEIAEKRLEAIRDFTEFGSGFKVAMRDLEIRGAGNLLGAEQHGHISSIGYDLYMKLLNEAILEEKGEGVKNRKECSVEMKVNAYLPEKYIKSPAARMETYKKIASIENEDDLDDITDELSDRYGVSEDGRLPREADALLFVSLLRALGSECGIAKIEHKEGSVLFWPDGKPELPVWIRLASENKGKIILNLSARPYISYRIRRDEEPLPFLCALLKQYLQIRSETAVAEEPDTNDEK